MATAVRGYALRADTILMYMWGCRCRHGQDAADATKAEGGGGAIARVTLRRDGFSSLGTADESTWDTHARFVTTVRPTTQATCRCVWLFLGLS